MIAGVIAKTTEFPLQLIGSVAGVSTARGGSDKAAQWEIRELAEEMMLSLYMLGGEWMEIIHMIEEKA